MKNTKNKYNASWNVNPSLFAPERNVGKSMTVQGEARTIQELVQRARLQGNYGGQEREVQYLDNEDIEKIDRFFSTDIDFSDLNTLRNKTVKLQSHIQNILAKQEALEKEDKEKRESIAKSESEARTQIEPPSDKPKSE